MSSLVKISKVEQVARNCGTRYEVQASGRDGETGHIINITFDVDSRWLPNYYVGRELICTLELVKSSD